MKNIALISRLEKKRIIRQCQYLINVVTVDEEQHFKGTYTAFGLMAD